MMRANKKPSSIKHISDCFRAKRYQPITLLTSCVPREAFIRVPFEDATRSLRSVKQQLFPSATFLAPSKFDLLWHLKTSFVSCCWWQAWLIACWQPIPAFYITNNTRKLPLLSYRELIRVHTGPTLIKFVLSATMFTRQRHNASSWLMKEAGFRANPVRLLS